LPRRLFGAKHPGLRKVVEKAEINLEVTANKVWFTEPMALATDDARRFYSGDSGLLVLCSAWNEGNAIFPEQ